MLSHARIESFHIFLDIVSSVLNIFFRYDLISFSVIKVFHSQVLRLPPFFQIIRKTLPVFVSFIYTPSIYIPIQMTLIC